MIKDCTGRENVTARQRVHQNQFLNAPDALCMFELCTKAAPSDLIVFLSRLMRVLCLCGSESTLSGHMSGEVGTGLLFAARRVGADEINTQEFCCVRKPTSSKTYKEVGLKTAFVVMHPGERSGKETRNKRVR